MRKPRDASGHRESPSGSGSDRDRLQQNRFRAQQGGHSYDLNHADSPGNSPCDGLGISPGLTPLPEKPATLLMNDARG
jgi:hypothetical protein